MLIQIVTLVLVKVGCFDFLPFQYKGSCMKTIKFLMLVSGLFISLPSVADSTGRAIIPHWNAFYSGTASNEFSSTQIHVSNLSDATVTVEINLYDAEGDIASSDDFDASILPVGALMNCNIMGTLCDLPAHSSGFFFIHNDSENEFPFTTGFGSLEWTSYNEELVSLVAHGIAMSEMSDTKSGRMKASVTIPINNGMPF